MLGTWHILKQGHAVVWALGSKTFFQPLFLALVPGAKWFNKGIKLRSQMNWMSYARLSYPGFKQQLKDALAHPMINHKSRVILQNLQTLMEVCIPIVSPFSRVGEVLFCIVK
jgi:hypothetical protein